MSLAQTLHLALSWYLVLVVVGLAAYPWLFRVCNGFYDRGASLYRAVGMAVVVLPFWILGNLTGISFNGWRIVLVALLLGIPGWWLAVAHWSLISFIRERWRYFLALETATGFLFFGYVLFRGFNPDIQGTEKPMELAFLNAAIHAKEIPVPDPWFAGESINYYYLGYVALGALAIASGISGEVAFNLGLATAFSLATVAAAGLAMNLTIAIDGYYPFRALTSGLLGGFLLALGANFHAAIELVRSPEETINAGWWEGIGWASSRVIEDTGFPDGGSRVLITEFPAFSWILGDLHPHVIAYPWMITAIALVANFFLLFQLQSALVIRLTGAVSAGVMAGVLYGSNTWDVPIVLLMLAGAALLLVRTTPWLQVLAAISGAIAGFLLTALPFMARYDSPTGEPNAATTGLANAIPMIGPLIDAIGYVSWDRTSTGEMMTHWGGLLVLTLVVLAVLYGLNQTQFAGSPRLLVGTALVLAVFAYLTGSPAILLFGLPAFLLLNLVLRGVTPPAETLVIAMISIALFILIVSEFFFVRDPFGDRMNTVFKTSFQVWAVLSITLAAFIPSVLTRISLRSGRVYLGAATVIVGIVLAVMSIYAPLSSYRWSGDMDQWRGIDGLAYIDRARPDEREAFEWLTDNRDDIGVVLEAPGCAYGSDNLLPHSRVSMATGIPTVIGWDGHQRQWRRGQPHYLDEIQSRIEDTRLTYETSPGHADLVRKYGISHVFVGTHEVAGYQRCALGPPYEIDEDRTLGELGWELEFNEGDVRIYRLP